MDASTNEIKNLSEVDLESPDMPDFVAIVFASEYQFDGDKEAQRSAFITQAQDIAERYGQKAIATWDFEHPSDGHKVAVAVSREERNEQEMCNDLVHHCDYTSGLLRADIEALQALKDEEENKIPELKDVDLESRDPADPVISFYARIDDDSKDALQTLKEAFAKDMRFTADRFSQDIIGTWIQPMDNGYDHVVISMTAAVAYHKDIRDTGLYGCEHCTGYWPATVQDLQDVKDGGVEMEPDPDNGKRHHPEP